MDKKEQARDRMRKMRERNKQRNNNEEDVTLNPESVTENGSVTNQDVTLIFPPSKFLSPEQDMIVQENVVNSLKAMSGSRRQAFMGLANSFIPNKIKNPGLEV